MTNLQSVRRLRLLALVSGVLSLIGYAPRALATSYDDRPKLLLHVRALTNKNQCGWGNLADCQGALTTGDITNGVAGPYYFVYLLAAPGHLRGVSLGGDGHGLAGFQCGIQYNGGNHQGVDVFMWTLCATLQFTSGGWPAAGSGNLITWDATNKCQLGETAIAGYFYCGAYTPDALRLVVRPADGRAAVADCGAAQYDLTEADLGSARFAIGGQSPGCNPCAGSCAPPTPVQPLTWSQIKSLYDRAD